MVLYGSFLRRESIANDALVASKVSLRRLIYSKKRKPRSRTYRRADAIGNIQVGFSLLILFVQVKVVDHWKYRQIKSVPELSSSANERRPK